MLVKLATRDTLGSITTDRWHRDDTTLERRVLARLHTNGIIKSFEHVEFRSDVFAYADRNIKSIIFTFDFKSVYLTRVYEKPCNIIDININI